MVELPGPKSCDMSNSHCRNYTAEPVKIFSVLCVPVAGSLLCSADSVPYVTGSSVEQLEFHRQYFPLG